MNNCVVELRGEVRNIIKFMIENINFVHVDENGVKFTAELNLGRLVKELDDDAMKELYGVPVSIPVRHLQVNVYKSEGAYCSCDEEEDDRPHDLYDFKIYNVGDLYDHYFNIEFKIVDGKWFPDHSHTMDKRKFMNEFFDKFSGLRKCCKDDMKVLDDWMSLEMEFLVYDVPTEITETWRNEYDVCTNVVYSEDGKVVKYYRYPNCGKEMDLEVITPESNMLRYTEELLSHKWANVHVMFNNFCHMLYDMKDSIPFDIDLEPNDRGGYKYNKCYGDLSQMFYSMARTNHRELAKIYVSVGNTYDKMFGKKPMDQIKLPDGKEDLF